MEQDPFDILRNLKRVEVADSLYGKVTQRIEITKVKTIPFYKAGIAASLILGLILAQLTYLSKSATQFHSSTHGFEILEINNNSLYYE